MKNFDWSKATLKHIFNVPKAVLGGFRLNTDDVPVLLKAGNITVAELWGNGWFMVGLQSADATRRAIACIDRIANYLTIHGGDS